MRRRNIYRKTICSLINDCRSNGDSGSCEICGGTINSLTFRATERQNPRSSAAYISWEHIGARGFSRLGIYGETDFSHKE